MVQETMKSPLGWSIGGVGLIAGSVIALSYWGNSQPPASNDTPAMAVETTAETAQFTPTATAPWERALEFGWEAAVAAQTAATEAEWRRVGDLWLQAVAELKQVPPDSPQRAEAQTKIQQYLANFEYAEGEKAKVRSTAPAASTPPASAVTGKNFNAESLKSALAANPINVQLTEAKRDNHQSLLTGQSADGQAVVELVSAGDDLAQAKLVLSKAQDPQQLAMTDVVYTNYFLAAAIPDWSGRNRWVLAGLKRIHQSPNQTVGAEVGPYQVAMARNRRGGQVIITVRSAP